MKPALYRLMAGIMQNTGGGELCKYNCRYVRKMEKTPVLESRWEQIWMRVWWFLSSTVWYIKARPHLYANANKACAAEANANKCQKVACSAFAAQANELAFRWSFVGCPNEFTSTSVRLWTYFSLKYWLQMDSVHLFAKHTPHKRMKANAVRLHVHIMRFCIHFAFTYRCGCGFTAIIDAILSSTLQCVVANMVWRTCASQRKRRALPASTTIVVNVSLCFGRLCNGLYFFNNSRIRAKGALHVAK